MPTPSLFPRKRYCSWIEVTDDLLAETCDDGTTMMWHDTATGDIWWANQPPPKKWRRFFRHRPSGGLGATVVPGMCPPHPTVAPHPSSKIVRLQKALQALARRVGDHALSVTADGLVGQHTVKAANRALYMYARGGAPSEFTTGSLTHSQIVAFAPQLAAYIDRSPIAASTRTSPATSPSLPEPSSVSVPVEYLPPSTASSTAPNSSGGSGPMPNYYNPYAPPPPAYPAPYYSNTGPGGLPADRASVDVKAFIPAQYEHVEVDPTTVMVLILVGLGVYYVATNHKKHKKES